MKIATLICFVILFCFLSVNHCEAHDAFYPHHLRDIKAAAKKGKILVITLIVSAGLMALVSTALVRSGKGKRKDDFAEKIEPAELRSHVIGAAIAGKRELAKSPGQALGVTLSAYATARGIEWDAGSLNNSTSGTYSIGRDRVTVIIPVDSSSVEVRAICGKIGASAIANAEGDSVRSSIFTARALETQENT
jgi:hypothetical protein